MPIDEAEVAEWERVYFREGMKIAAGRETVRKVRGWARSMALTAEQHAPNDDGEAVDVEHVA